MALRISGKGTTYREPIVSGPLRSITMHRMNLLNGSISFSADSRGIATDALQQYCCTINAILVGYNNTSIRRVMAFLLLTRGITTIFHQKTAFKCCMCIRNLLNNFFYLDRLLLSLSIFHEWFGMLIICILQHLHLVVYI